MNICMHNLCLFTGNVWIKKKDYGKTDDMRIKIDAPLCLFPFIVCSL